MFQARPQRLILALVGASVALLTPSVPAASLAIQSLPAPTRALEKGEALMEEGNYRAAIRALKKAEGLSQEASPQVLLDLAICFNLIGDSENGESYARRALEVAEDPVQRAGAYYMLGVSLLGGGGRRPHRLEEAVAAFRKVSELSDGQVPVARLYGTRLVERLERSDEAVALLQAPLEIYPTGPDSKHTRGLIGRIEAPGPGIPVGGDLRPPEKIFAPMPELTEAARTGGIQGVVKVRLIIDKSGSATNVEILKGLSLDLDRCVEETVRRWKFKPATLNGEGVAVYYNVTFNFRWP